MRFWPIYNRTSNMNYFTCTSRHFPAHGRYWWTHHIDLAPGPMSGFLAQLVKHRTGIAEVTGSNPVKALISGGWSSIGKSTAILMLISYQQCFFNSYLVPSVLLTMDDSNQEKLDLNYQVNGTRFYPGKVSNMYIIKWMPTEGSITNFLSWLNNQVFCLAQIQGSSLWA